MKKALRSIFYSILVELTVLLNYSFSQEPNCVENMGLCIECNKETNLCNKCSYSEVAIPDEYGGCKGRMSCSNGKNNCKECDPSTHLCKVCNQEFSFPDENGACCSDPNCKISYNGYCVECKKDYILYHPDIKTIICRHKDSEIYKHCNETDWDGSCKNCEEGFYVASSDKRCVTTKYCKEGKDDLCILCNNFYYLDKSDKNKCKSNMNIKYLHGCKITEDGINCKKCQDGYYKAYQGSCVYNAYCEKSKETSCYCEECDKDFFLSSDGLSCVDTQYCMSGDKNFGVCKYCQNGYKLNKEDMECIKIE